MTTTRTQGRLTPDGPLFSGLDCPRCGTPYAVCAARVRDHKASCCHSCHLGHEERLVEPDRPFDQEVEEDTAVVREVLLKDAVEHLPRRPDGNVDIIAMVAEGNRRAVLNVVTRRAIAEAMAALDNPWKWAGRFDALEILKRESLRYERLGGDLHPWGV